MSSLFSSVFCQFWVFCQWQMKSLCCSKSHTPLFDHGYSQAIFWAILCRVTEACSLQNTEGFSSNPWVLKESLRYFPVLNFFKRLCRHFCSNYTKAVASKRPTLKRGWRWPQASTQMYGGGMKKFQKTNFDMKISPSFALLMFGFRMGLGMAPELHPEVWSGSG